MRIPFSVVFLALVFGEIAGFVMVGQAIGVLPTLALVFLGMVAGMFLLRAHGIATLMKVRAETDAGRFPGRPLAEGAMLALAALLIILPGFITDAAGLLLLLPFVRSALLRLLRSRIDIRTARGGSVSETGVVELDESEYKSRPRAGGSWRRLGKGSWA